MNAPPMLLRRATLGATLNPMTDPLSPLIDARVRDALETVYQQFATLVPPVIEGCPCCLATRGVDVLLTTPLRALTGKALWRYVSGVFYTVGSECDFRYFLPRILDIAINDPGNSNNVEIVLGKLRLANLQSWSAGERAAIETLVDVWFDRVLANDLAEADEGWVGWEAESVLCGAARAGLSLTGLLARLQEPDAAAVLADLRERSRDGLSAFWKDVPADLSALSALLAREQLADDAPPVARR